MVLTKSKVGRRGSLAPDLSHIAMSARLRFTAVFIVLVCIDVAPVNDRAFAISVELARKCNALTAKAFPPRVVGNPAAGSVKGTGQDERAYYRKCVANEGKGDAPTK